MDFFFEVKTTHGLYTKFFIKRRKEIIIKEIKENKSKHKNYNFVLLNRFFWNNSFLVIQEMSVSPCQKITK